MKNYSEAVAHYQQLRELGADEEQAAHDTMVAFDLLTHEADLLKAIYE